MLLLLAGLYFPDKTFKGFWGLCHTYLFYLFFLLHLLPLPLFILHQFSICAPISFSLFVSFVNFGFVSLCVQCLLDGASKIICRYNRRNKWHRPVSWKDRHTWGRHYCTAQFKKEKQSLACINAKENVLHMEWVALADAISVCMHLVKHLSTYC